HEHISLELLPHCRPDAKHSVAGLQRKLDANVIVPLHTSMDQPPAGRQTR
ncbi:6598_t:CDS:1, partial [Ambispora leptoticha]